MFLCNLPDDTIFEVISYFSKNKDSLFFLTCTKELYKFMKKNGFMVHVELTDSAKKYIQQCNANQLTLQKIFLLNMENPANWIFNYPRFVECSNCVFTEPFLPSGRKPVHTKDLILRSSKGLRTKLVVKWELFPKLRKVLIKAWDVDLTGLDMLPELEMVYIQTNYGYYTKSGKNGKIIFANSDTNFVIETLAVRITRVGR